LSIENRIRLLRETLGYTQKDFAYMLGVTFKTYWRYETGKGTVPSSLLSLLVEKHNASPSWLLTGEGEMFIDKKPDELDGLIMDLASVDPDLSVSFRNLRGCWQDIPAGTKRKIAEGMKYVLGLGDLNEDEFEIPRSDSEL
jgi:transcriptional regulator with XRE-family HTH domain